MGKRIASLFLLLFSQKKNVAQKPAGRSGREKDNAKKGGFFAHSSLLFSSSFDCVRRKKRQTAARKDVPYPALVRFSSMVSSVRMCCYVALGC